jgi:hypothetical protein
MTARKSWVTWLVSVEPKMIKSDPVVALVISREQFAAG